MKSERYVYSISPRKFQSKKTMEHENGNRESSHCREGGSQKERRAWGVSALTGYGITPVDRIMSEYVIEGNVREREESVGISTGRCLRGLKWYWGLSLCEILGGLLPSRVLCQWHTSAVCGPIYLACRG